MYVPEETGLDGGENILFAAAAAACVLAPKLAPLVAVLSFAPHVIPVAKTFHGIGKDLLARKDASPSDPQTFKHKASEEPRMK